MSIIPGLAGWQGWVEGPASFWANSPHRLGHLVVDTKTVRWTHCDSVTLPLYPIRDYCCVRTTMFLGLVTVVLYIGQTRGQARLLVLMEASQMDLQQR